MLFVWLFEAASYSNESKNQTKPENYDAILIEAEEKCFTLIDFYFCYVQKQNWSD